MLLVFFSDTAYCRNPCTEKWFKYDDDHVSEIKESDVKVGSYRIYVWRQGRYLPHLFELSSLKM